MDICFLLSSLNFGGAERVASTLCNSWAKIGHKVTLIATYNGCDESYFELSSQIELVYLAHEQDCFLGKSSRSLSRLFKLRYILKRNRPDVLVSFLPSSNVMGILAGFNLDIPTIVCERTDPEFFPQPWIWKLACRHLYRFADVLTVQTENVASKTERLFRSVRQVKVIPNPLPFFPQANADSVLSESRVLVSVGRLIDSKQVDHAVSAFLDLHEDFPAWQLHIYGDGAERLRLIDLVNKNRAEAFIKVLGETSSPWEIMQQAEGFVMTSRFEGFPNALLEALALGLPTVVYDCPSGPAEITQRGEIALLVPLNDTNSLRDAMRRLMEDRQLRQSLHSKAMLSVERRYSLNSVLEQWQHLFDIVVKDQSVKGRCQR